MWESFRLMTPVQGNSCVSLSSSSLVARYRFMNYHLSSLLPLRHPEASTKPILSSFCYSSCSDNYLDLK